MEILIADDDEIIRHLLADHLTRWGYRVTEASDGAQALARLHADDAPRLAILDWLMPVQDGIDVCRALRAQPDRPYTYLILLTSKNQRADFFVGMEAGVDNYLMKPLDAEELRTAVNVGARIIGLQSDLEQRHAETVLTEERLSMALHGGNEGVWDWDFPSGYAYFSPQWASLLGYAEDEVTNEIGFWEQRVHPDDAPHVIEALTRHLHGKSPRFEAEYRLQMRQGEWKWVLSRGLIIARDEHGGPLRMSGTLTDITNQKQRELALQQQAMHDPLTQLPNRLFFHERLLMAVALAQRKDEKLAVLYCDLDGFKQINDTYGHSVGDQVLIEVARRIHGLLRQEDTFARIGGDEFILLLPSVAGRDDAVAVAHRIRHALREPFIREGYHISISASIGISLCPDDAEQVDALIRQADEAMYQVKSAGKDGVSLSKRGSVPQSPREHAALADAFRQALVHGTLELYYQPEMHHSGSLLGLEALLRWQHPQYGLMLPEEFLSLADELDMTRTLCAWMLRQACAQHRQWSALDLPPFRITVSLTKSQFFLPELPSLLQQVITETKIPPAQLNLALPERIVMENMQRSGEILRQLTDLGVQATIDHFGTEISSFVQLRNLPITAFKLDQSMTRNILCDPGNQTLMDVAVNLAQNLQLQLMVCGIETSREREYYQQYQCNGIQGNAIGKPLPVHEITPVLQRWQLGVLPYAEAIDTK